MSKYPGDTKRIVPNKVCIRDIPGKDHKEREEVPEISSILVAISFMELLTTCVRDKLRH
ncbi:uncharacterized protein RAG0_00836 [Rhynchosporium agropyri]|uniref:Uncharacterized protein n=2 Tax=Rhynchosporium TaxID=38037 RepID=A0A1E1JUL5_9HELO|nr:uncharacterized protein RCO7_14141 [Rhynchosporium commune]CZS89422.1 uncharacterized protein RAG0_00836 [Rhynchosporium agropyri]